MRSLAHFGRRAQPVAPDKKGDKTEEHCRTPRNSRFASYSNFGGLDSSLYPQKC